MDKSSQTKHTTFFFQILTWTWFRRMATGFLLPLGLGFAPPVEDILTKVVNCKNCKVVSYNKIFLMSIFQANTLLWNLVRLEGRSLFTKKICKSD